MRFDVFGLGNALVDALVVGDDGPVLRRHELRRGTMLLVDDHRWRTVFEEVRHGGVVLQPGGSCSNAICTVALLGGRATFCGLVGDDELGDAYLSRLTALLGEHHHLVRHVDVPTGKCLSLISDQDAERTMLTDLGTAMDLPPEDLPVADLVRAEIFLLTGYVFTGGRMRETAWKALDAARAAGLRIAFDVADAFVIEHCREDVDRVLAEYADIVFMNEAEAACLVGEAGDAIARVAPRAELVVLKLGKRGSMVRYEGDLFSVAPVLVEAVDTTGAGDAYAGGFLYGLCNGLTPAESGRVASAVAALTVSQVGGVVRDRDRLQRLLAELLAAPAAPVRPAAQPPA